MLERRVIAVEGVVQGVGFRPYVHRLAAANVLRGFVRNDAAGVLIEVQGESDRVDEFCRLLTLAPPALATIARLRVERGAPREYDDFRIAPSSAAGAHPVPGSMPADAATCDACLTELFDQANRRCGHPFITCTECGPRFTIIRGAPFDRERTTMADFPLCARCQREYGDPEDRRFHAESISCPSCGPTLTAYRPGAGESRVTGQAAIAAAVSVLCGGRILAIKALGGFHLACDATDENTVQRLRRRKQRPTRPFAVMMRDVKAAERFCELTSEEQAALTSPARPVVLLTPRPFADMAAGVAPSSATLGVMLPSTPLHHLLLSAVDRPLVMTSGNRGGEPVVMDAASALAAIGDIADLFLTHNRDIVARCDDSVVRVTRGETRAVRRSRGYVPQPITMPFRVQAPVLAMGGHLKNTVCVATGESAHLSAHVGDLDTAPAREAIRSAIENTVLQAGARPAVIAHDLHPEYASTVVAHAFAADHGITQRVPVQHHHAHIAACLAEHRVLEPVIGVAFDGAGLGSDGAIWGGEFLAVDGARFTRRGHLGYVPLPGGDAAARKPWRAAASHLSRVNCAASMAATFHPPGIRDDEWLFVQTLISRRELIPQTSSVGRLFDAVASLLGICHEASFEGEAAMRLEAIAGSKVSSRYPVTLSCGATWTSDPASIIEGVVADVTRGRSRSDIAAAFHGAMRDLVVIGCERIREDSGLETVVLSGGVFVNALLAASAHEALSARRFRVLAPRLVPCNDGGLSLGQAYVAACALREELCA